MRSILFTSKAPPYNAGELAGFPDAQAARFVEAGVAEYADQPAEPPADDAPPADEGEDPGESEVMKDDEQPDQPKDDEPAEPKAADQAPADKMVRRAVRK